MNALLQILLPASLFAAAPVADAMAPQPMTDDARPERARRGDKARKGKTRDHRMRADRGERGKRGDAKRSSSERVQMRFARIDADGSGQITLAEMMAAEKARRAKRSGKKDRKAKRSSDKKRGDKKARSSKRGGNKQMKNRGKNRKRFANRGSKQAA